MTIIADNIKHLKSERMTDAGDGGGRMTSNEVPDGVAGSIFPKVSRLDTVYGRFELRKIYAAVRSSLADVYGGAHTIFVDAPNNPRIGVVMFSTRSHFDTRAEAQDYVESYVVAGPLSRARIYGNQAAGKALLLYQRVEEPLPDVGQVLCLSVEAAGYTAAQQYVSISEVDHEIRTFTDASGDFERRVILVKITTTLSQIFPGAEPSRYANDPSPTKVRETQSSSNAHYFGIRTLTESLSIGSLAGAVDSIYSPLVPSTQRETAISLVEPVGADGWVAAGAPITVYASPGSAGQTSSFFMPTSILPGSWTIDSGLNLDIYDDGAGNVVGKYGTTGVIDYETGLVTLTWFPTYAFFYGNFNAAYTPAIRAQARSHTSGIPVTLGTRGYVYTFTCSPLPAKGSAVVEYRALGKWYRLRDNGAGILVGNSAGEGTGNVSYSSGALTATLGALPDIDSRVVISWGSPAHYDMRAGADSANSSKQLEMRFTLTDLPVKSGSVSISLRATPSDVTPFVYTDAALGVLSSAGLRSGRIDYVTGEVVLPVPMNSDGKRPSLDTLVNVAYQQEVGIGGAAVVTTAIIPVTTPAAWNCGATNIAPGGVRIVVPVDARFYSVGPVQDVFVTLIDDRAGNLVTLAGEEGTTGSLFTVRRWWSAGDVVGSINYTTGDVTLTDIALSANVWQGTVWAKYNVGSPVSIGDYTVTTKAAGVSYLAQSDELLMSDVGYTFDLTATTGEPVMPGSVVLKFGNFWFFDRGGLLYYDISSATNTGTQCGTVDYGSGQVRITALPVGWMEETGWPVKACLTTHGDFSITSAAFRTAGSPVRPGSTYLQATAIDGSQCSGSADINGVITGTHLRGVVDAVSGVAFVEFGDLVGAVWTPREVWPASLRYSCVVISNLALDSTILGVDPVRLPSDGRVQVIRPADVAVIHQTAALALPNPAVAGSVIDTGRDPRSITDPYSGEAVTVPAATRLELRDAAGKQVATSLYTRDFENGTITLANPLDLTGYTQPLSLRHGVEDMVLIDDVQITGEISFSSTPLLYAYTPGAYISTALLAGDIGARVEHVFDQSVWTNVWSNSLIGSEAAGQFNDLQYPILVANDGAIKERWRAQVTGLSPLTVAIYGESLGLIGTYNATGTISPVNPLTGTSYFTIQPGAWGAGGFSIANNVRWNTEAGAYPVWIARTILGGAARTGDSFDIETRGDVD